MLIGLTGGIGSGKSLVAKMFGQAGAGIVDTDTISHQLTLPGGAALDAITACFGSRYVSALNGLERDKMRELVFADARARRDLEAILHPLIHIRAVQALRDMRAPYAVLVVPLLFEGMAYRTLVQCSLVVDCSIKKQIERVMKRSQFTQEAAAAIIKAQVSRSVRLQLADDVISNEGDESLLATQVMRLHGEYLECAPRHVSSLA
jgi:dephospho-CoA kinase